MAKRCVLTGDIVLYLDCLECDNKDKCEEIKAQKSDIEKGENTDEEH